VDRLAIDVSSNVLRAKQSVGAVMIANNLLLPRVSLYVERNRSHPGEE